MIVMELRATLFLMVLTVSSFALADEPVPITAFHQVNASIYRGGRPDEAGIAALAKMKIKTILNLENDPQAVAEEIRIANLYGIKVISTPMSGFWYPRDRQVQRSLRAMEDPANQPVFVHCQHGEDRTGLIVGLYRVFYQKWAPEAAWNEMEDLGFHRILFLLQEYFENATGFED